MHQQSHRCAVREPVIKDYSHKMITARIGNHKRPKRTSPHAKWLVKFLRDLFVQLFRARCDRKLFKRIHTDFTQYSDDRAAPSLDIGSASDAHNMASVVRAELSPAPHEFLKIVQLARRVSSPRKVARNKPPHLFLIIGVGVSVRRHQIFFFAPRFNLQKEKVQKRQDEHHGRRRCGKRAKDENTR